MGERSSSFKRDILLQTGAMVGMIVELDLSIGATYDVLMQAKAKLDAVGIPTNITNGGISLSVNRETNATAESILSEFGLEMKETDVKKYDGDSAGRSDVTENQL